MPDITALAQAFGAIKSMKDIAEAMIGLRDAASFRERQIEFQGKIIEAQNALFALQDERSSLIERIGNLEKQIADLKAWDAEKDKYELKQISETGAMAYMLKPDARGTEPPHWLCAQCYENRKKSIFQPIGSLGIDAAFWKCPQYENRFQTYGDARPTWVYPE